MLDESGPYVARLILDPERVVGPVRRRMFGSFVEHMGRSVYTGIFEPDHPAADDDGHRVDVLELVREMGVSVVRYPGGNFVSGYRWEDGIGPIGARPRRLDSAWHSLETNQHGISEFITWARKAGVEPNYAINLGTRGIEEALDVLEYANHPSDTYWSERRISDGHTEPFDIKLWCLGNEMDGPWQTGHKTAREYGRLAAEVARAMRQRQPNLELVVCGSSHSAMPTFGEWEATVLEESYEQVDFISAHAYYNQRSAGNLRNFLASAVDMEGFIQKVIAVADHVGAKLRSKKQINVAFDEWNVWDEELTGVPVDDWPIAPSIAEDVYTVVDAVVVGSLLISLLRHSDRVAVACQAQLVNALAPIRTAAGGPAWRQASFFPFSITSRLATGSVLDVQVACPDYETDSFGRVPVVHAVATHNPELDQLVVFVVNRHPEEEVTLQIPTRPFGRYGFRERHLVHDSDMLAVNTEDNRARVGSRTTTDYQMYDGGVEVRLPALSWSAVLLNKFDPENG